MPTEVQIYKDGTVVAADIAADAVGTLNIKDGNVTSAKLEENSNGKGKRTVSTFQPNGGSNGDIWYVVEPASSSSSIASIATQVIGPDGVDTADLVSGTMATNDKFRIRISADPDPITGATLDRGFAEIATANNGNEPIYVRQYTLTGSGSNINHFANITRTATLLDRNGNTTFPGIVTATTFNGNLTGNATTATSATTATTATTATSATSASTVSSIRTNTGLLSDKLHAPALIDGLTDLNFRSVMFGKTDQGYALSAARWNDPAPAALNGLSAYGTAIAWAGADTHGFLALNYDTAGATIGGGNENKIRWKATLLHSLNYNSYSPTLTGTGASGNWDINAKGLSGSPNITVGTVTATSVSGNGTIPVRGIIMWSGTVANIPSGWALCDGNNDTPNLQDKFVVGAGSGYAVAATGGSANATLVSHSHTAISNVIDPGHTHTSVLYNGLGSGFQGGGGQGVRHNINVGSNTTGITVNTTLTSAGDPATNKNLPPYYALAFIMRTV
jgi:hypothetical protein